MDARHGFFCGLVLTASSLACDRATQESAPNETGSAPPSTAAPSSGMRSPFAPKPAGPRMGPPPEQHLVGSVAKARDYSLTVHAVKPCSVEAHFRPKTGTIKLGVEVEVEATGKREVPANPLYATLVDAENQTYPATLAGCAPVLTVARLENGQTARGIITFDVPEKASGLVMKYAPFIVGSGAQELEFVLGR